MGESEPARTEGEGPGGDIQVIARIATLLECLDPGSPSLDTATTAKVLGVGRSTAHRYLASLEKRGLLRRRDVTTYEPGPALCRIGTLALARLGVVEAAGPVMHELVQEVRSTVVLSVWGGQAPVVARVVPDTSRFTTLSVEVGRSLPPEAAQSRLFAAHHARSRRVGGRLRVLDDGLIPIGDLLVARQVYPGGGVKTIAAPVRTADGTIVATLAVIGMTVFMPDDEDDVLVERLTDAVSRIAVN
ncbi:IclR family transcriptional regulator [Pseudonocardia thermophila]|mgnify:CR=1 FL=1|uniref:IclR family transcriptional regulator n=1 Tax=Pseudonocardia thermophila TaxID=1848 RepID=UPI00248E39D4|nr:helix-turn-helix domain-containing protein [Pseudonocardia thermophila]